MASVSFCWLAAISAAEPKSFGDWVVECEPNAALCTMSQVAMMTDSRERLMQVDFVFSEQGNALSTDMIVILPLGSALDIDPELYIENSLVGPLQARYCLIDGCYYFKTVDRALLERFLRMHSGYVKIHSRMGESLSVPISGKGSRAAFNFHYKGF